MKNLSSVFLGVVFILAGVAILLNQYHVWRFGWLEFYPLALIAVGIYFILDMVQGNKGAIFWATLMITLGLFFFLRNFGYIPFFWIEEFWPLFMLAFGLAFISLFIIKPEDWGLLIPGAILMVLGLFIASHTLGFHWYPIRFLWRFWPLLLVLVGVVLIVNSIRQRNNSAGKTEEIESSPQSASTQPKDAPEPDDKPGQEP